MTNTYKNWATATAAAVAMIGAMGSTASAVSLGDFGTATNDIGAFQQQSGGEFYVQIHTGPITNASYAAATKDQGGILNSFQSFCLEVYEDLGGPGLQYVVNDAAVGGGANVHLPTDSPTGGDIISVGTAWLYAQFAQGNLAGYQYFAEDWIRRESAGKLQDAIWALEDEQYSPAPGTNIFFDAAVAFFGSAAAAQANAAAGTSGVYVLNFTLGNEKKQDMLYYEGGGSSVPDGGATALLLGLSLIGVFSVSRMQRTAKVTE